MVMMLLFSGLSAVSTPSAEIKKLREVKTIYVAEQSEAIRFRKSIIQELNDSELVTTVDSPEAADAILTYRFATIIDLATPRPTPTPRSIPAKNPELKTTKRVDRERLEVELVTREKRKLWSGQFMVAGPHFQESNLTRDLLNAIRKDRAKG